MRLARVVAAVNDYYATEYAPKICPNGANERDFWGIFFVHYKGTNITNSRRSGTA
jgi:hypothetical protein